MSNKKVLFLGAGFSVGAKIPIQNKILEEMQKSSESLTSANALESIKFLKAYIEVGLFILQKFSSVPVDGILEHLEIVKYIERWKNIFRKDSPRAELSNISKKFSDTDEIIKSFFEGIYTKDEGISSLLQLDTIFTAHYYKLLVELKEEIRSTIEQVNPKVDLEDIFTLFDKCYRENENWDSITYIELDKLRHYILRLFTYYFGLRLRAFENSKSKYYDGFVNYCKSNKVSIITTNWDSVVEILFRKNSINYQTHEEQAILNKDFTNVIKLHGSINWVRCNACGKYFVQNNKNLADYLFDDKREEHCVHCSASAIDDQIILQPEIITPTMLKTLNSKLYRDIWSDAVKEIEQGDNLIFIGYSLPQADFEIRYLLKKHISPKASIDVVLTKNDMPKNNNFSPENRYRALFSLSKIKFHYCGCKNFFNWSL